MDKPVIELENISKLYNLGTIGVTTLRESFSHWWYKVRRKEHLLQPILEHQRVSMELGEAQSGPEPNTIWALKDVSFSAAQGEIVGIIGRNGAGKTTLLKILSRITDPTSGNAVIRGRVSSLLEIGTGFHPELTGRENVYLNGTILGMRKREIDRKYNEIVVFSEIEKFMDTPVKRYSSGMYVRLAFAVAAHLEPEILLVDEVLAVGDVSFQQKCLGKVGDIASGGRTVLFVSHNLQAISALTKRTLLFKGGRILFDGETSKAISIYRESYRDKSDNKYVSPLKGDETRLADARVITSDGNNVHQFGKPLSFEFKFFFCSKPTSGSFSFQIINEEQGPIASLWLLDSERRWSRKGHVFLKCVIDNPRLYMGSYSLTTWLGDRSNLEVIEKLTDICRFEITMDNVPREYDWKPNECAYLETARWEV